MVAANAYGSQMTAQFVSRNSPIVFVVDDDISVRESLEALILLEGMEVRTFSSAQDFLVHPRTPAPSCMILDVSLPGLNGLELQKRVSSEHRDMPIIFITGHGDIPMSVQAIKAGAVEFLTKPFADDVLLNAIRHAVGRSRALLAREEDLRSLKKRYAQLTPRECEVMAQVVVGSMNKHIAAELGISETTVKAHRGCVMRKMNADSLAELVMMAARLRLPRSAAAKPVTSK
ncbi:response regulator transcription factor [Tunturiibacter lichenicola]|uniref:response regulator transcription factor n=1 Tax=Tunturiibacter lichenicola TaxID=2051959 RepID=UPI0021B4AFC8|nr:response regulator [Edaphobacter lichenicola]